MATYTWLTLSQALSALQGRLANSTFWSSGELTVYIQSALRTWNALTEQWKQDFTFTGTAGWYNTGTRTGSPRLRTVTDANLYTQMQYMLLEAASGGGAWGGTSQFDLPSLQYALMRRRDEVIQAAACNLNVITIPSTPGVRRNVFPDTTLEPVRIRFFGATALTTATAASGSQMLAVTSAAGIAIGQTVAGTNLAPGTFVTGVAGTAVSISLPTIGSLSSTTVQFFSVLTLTREDTQAFQYFEPNYLQTAAFPQSWSVASEPPLAFDTDNAPLVNGSFDAVVLQSGPTFAPPANSLLGVPDDWSWLPMVGALGDLLGSGEERTDPARAQYCLQRFVEGLKIFRQSNWLVQANIDGVPVDTPSMFEQDTFSPEWQTNGLAWPTLTQAGMDLVAGAGGINVTLVGNQPVPILPGDFLQVSRDVWDVVLSYAQHLATFKQGGDTFAATTTLYKDFQRAAAETNSRLLELGIFADVLNTEGQRQNVLVPR